MLKTEDLFVKEQLIFVSSFLALIEFGNSLISKILPNQNSKWLALQLL